MIDNLPDECATADAEEPLLGLAGGLVPSPALPPRNPVPDTPKARIEPQS